MKKKVYLIGRDYVNWATDDDYFFIRKALEPLVEFTDDPAACDVIHSINWHSLTSLDRNLLKQKYVITHIPHDVRRMLSTPSYLLVAPFIDLWCIPSRRAHNYSNVLGLPCRLIPYGINQDIFYPIEGPQAKMSLREKYGIPQEAYVIGSFQRDTEGKDLTTPKYIKGPDLFFEIVRTAGKNYPNIHVVLAGPRRFWLRKKLEKAGINYTFAGKKIDARDDIAENTLPHDIMNELYNLSDLYIVSSRMEGGPKAILECAATKTAILSTPVGIAEDVLTPVSIYTSFSQAAQLIGQDIEKGVLKKETEQVYRKIGSHIQPAITALLEQVYAGKMLKQEHAKKIVFKEVPYGPTKNTLWRKITRKLGLKKQKNLTIFFKLKQGPWGGGNQFLRALSGGLRKRGIAVHTGLRLSSQRILFNSFHIDSDMIAGHSFHNKFILHRIDGPTNLIRGKDKELDDKIFAINQKIAHVSIFQSYWSFFVTVEQGYVPVNPVVIHNACDPALFNHQDKVAFNASRKIKLVSTSWSNNKRKGGPIYKWLDEHLDFDRYEYTFIGNTDEDLRNITVIPPVDPKKLAGLLKQHDIYITASDNDPCSNALLEALSCGLPAVYLNKGGHPELVQFGGLSFNEKEEIPELIDRIAANYESYSNLVTPFSMNEIAWLYHECLDIST